MQSCTLRTGGAFGTQRPALRSHRAVVARAKVSPEAFLEDLHAANWGKTRFIVLADGAILESVSTFSKPRYTEIPKKGKLATISSEDKTFECHVYLSKVTTVKMVQSTAKSGTHQTYATRMLGEGNKVYMSLLLHGTPEPSPEAVEAWKAVRTKYAGVNGDTITF